VGLAYAKLSDIQVDGPAQAADALRGILNAEPGPKRDIALLNAGAALVIAGAASDLPEGIALAASAVDSGRTRETLAALVRCSQT